MRDHELKDNLKISDQIWRGICQLLQIETNLSKKPINWKINLVENWAINISFIFLSVPDCRAERKIKMYELQAEHWSVSSVIVILMFGASVAEWGHSQ